MNERSPEPTVYLVDDDPSVLRALKRLLGSMGWNVVTAASAREFRERRAPDVHGCVVVDVNMPGESGFDLQQSIHAAGNPLPIVFLTGRGDIPMSVRAMKSGAVDFLSKPCREEDLITAIRQALARDREAREARAEQQAALIGLAALTPREREVMLGVVAGRLNKQIADDLGIAEKTVKVHRARVMEKLRVGSVADLVRLVERAKSLGWS